MTKVLVIEDDLSLSSVITDQLEDQYMVDCAHDGLEGLRRMQSVGYDVVVLDWDLPELAGIDVCTAFRQAGGNTPILMLTGKTDIIDKQRGFEAGVDDYLTKPFILKELSLRIQALTRRCTMLASDILRAKNIELDCKSFALKKDGSTITMIRSDFLLLEFLMRNPNRVFSADALLAKVYLSTAEYTPEAIRSSIRRIRQNLGEDPESSIIKTIHRVGYKLVP